MNEKAIDPLNTVRMRELTVTAQYVAQHQELEDSDFGKLASKLKGIGIQEMKHAGDLAERILFLNGEPTSKPGAGIKRGQEISEMLATDIVLESQAIKIYNQAAVTCNGEKDQISKQLFEKPLGDEEEKQKSDPSCTWSVPPFIWRGTSFTLSSLPGFPFRRKLRPNDGQKPLSKPRPVAFSA